MTAPFFDERAHTARTPHRWPCFYCLTPIKPGDRYVRQVSRWGRRWHRVTFHDECGREVHRHGAGVEEDWPEGALDGSYIAHDDCSEGWRTWFAARAEDTRLAAPESGA